MNGFVHYKSINQSINQSIFSVGKLQEGEKNPLLVQIHKGKKKNGFQLSYFRAFNVMGWEVFCNIVARFWVFQVVNK